jgi:hypothetical protein
VHGAASAGRSSHHLGLDRRRFLLTLASAVARPPATQAEQAGKMPRIGVLQGTQPNPDPMFEAFRQGVREAGYTEGQNILLEPRWAKGNLDRSGSRRRAGLSEADSRRLISSVRRRTTGTPARPPLAELRGWLQSTRPATAEQRHRRDRQAGRHLGRGEEMAPGARPRGSASRPPTPRLWPRNAGQTSTLPFSGRSSSAPSRAAKRCAARG